MADKIFSLRLPEELLTFVQHVSEISCISVGEYIRQVLYKEFYRFACTKYDKGSDIS